MFSTSHSRASSRVGAEPSLWDVPPALWLYGLLRSLAFVAPSWSEDGQVGLGVLVVLVLYAFVLRRSRRAWITLVAIDALSHLILITTWLAAIDGPLLVPILAIASIVPLLLPSTRRYLATGSAERTHQYGPRAIDDRPTRK